MVVGLSPTAYRLLISTYCLNQKCPERDLNSHGCNGHRILSPACLPIPPPGPRFSNLFSKINQTYAIILVQSGCKSNIFHRDFQIKDNFLATKSLFFLNWFESHKNILYLQSFRK